MLSQLNDLPLLPCFLPLLLQQVAQLGKIQIHAQQESIPGQVPLLESRAFALELLHLALVAGWVLQQGLLPGLSLLAIEAGWVLQLGLLPGLSLLAVETGWVLQLGLLPGLSLLAVETVQQWQWRCMLIGLRCCCPC